MAEQLVRLLLIAHCQQAEEADGKDPQKTLVDVHVPEEKARYTTVHSSSDVIGWQL